MNKPMLTPPEHEPELLVRPAPGRQEGPCGYLLRLAEANCLRLDELEQSGIHFDLACLIRNKLLPTRDLDPGLHAHVVRIVYLQRNKNRIWNTRYVRFCPHCLAENQTWRAGWEVMFHDVCPHHGVWLIDQCSSCEKPVSWNRDSLLRCQCGSDLRQEKASPAPENAKRLAGLLESRLLGMDEGDVPVPLAQLDLEQTQRLIRFIGGYLDPNSGAKPLKLRNAGKMEVSWPVTSLAAEMLYQWPTGFNAAFSRLQEASLGVKTGLAGLFQQAYRYLYKGLEEKAFLPIRQAFEEWVAEFWKGGVARRNRRLATSLLERVAWIPGKVAADRLGITIKRLKHLVQEGLLEAQESVSPTTGRHFLVVRNDGLEAISQQLASEMDMTTAMKAIGLCKLRMQQIIRLLFPTARRLGIQPGAPWLIPRDEVEALLTIGEGLPVVSIPDESQVSV
ncbi:MAG: TniQ family protein [Thiobacillus sp.]